MSVIAKMNVVSVRPFGATRLVKLSCVYDPDIASEKHEDKRFTKASPSGEADLSIANTGIPLKDRGQVYLLFIAKGEEVQPRSAFATMRVRINSITDFGGNSRQVEIVRDHYGDDEGVDPGRSIGKAGALNMRMHIDNPGAFEQFKPGESWALALYDAQEVSLDQAIAGA